MHQSIDDVYCECHPDAEAQHAQIILTTPPLFLEIAASGLPRLRAVVPGLRGVRIPGLGLIDRCGWCPSRAQCGWGPLLNRLRITADRGEISGHSRRFPRTRGVVLPQKCCAGRLDFARAAVARVAGV